MPRLTIQQMTVLAWTWQGPTKVSDEEGSHFELRIAELPDFLLAAETHGELLAELKPALRSYLQTYVDQGANPPLPPLNRWNILAGFPLAAPQTGRAQQAPEVARA